MFNLVVDGVVVEQWKAQPVLHKSLQVVDDSGAKGVTVGWTYKDGKFAAPVQSFTKLQLYEHLEDKVNGLRTASRNYAVAGLSGPIFDDSGKGTMENLVELWASMSLITFPMLYSDENRKVWSLTQAQLTQFITEVFAYNQSVWTFMNGTALPQIESGAISTPDQIDALSWPV